MPCDGTQRLRGHFFLGNFLTLSGFLPDAGFRPIACSPFVTVSVSATDDARFFDQRAITALRACSLRCSGVRPAHRALPPSDWMVLRCSRNVNSFLATIRSLQTTARIINISDPRTDRSPREPSVLHRAANGEDLRAQQSAELALRCELTDNQTLQATVDLIA
jgi:hypothetical protein